MKVNLCKYIYYLSYFSEYKNLFLIILFISHHLGQFLISAEQFYLSGIGRKPSYTVIASKYLRPGHLYKLSATIFKSETIKTNVFVSIYKDYELVSSVTCELQLETTQEISLEIPTDLTPGNYKLRIEKNWGHNIFVKNTLIGETLLIFLKRFLTIKILLEKPVYKQNDKIRFKVVPILSNLSLFTETFDIQIKDANGNVLRKWYLKIINSNLTNFEYQIGNQVAFGKWTIEAIVQQYKESSSFLVKEYYLNELEVSISMADIFKSTDPFVYGSIIAKLNDDISVCGNVTLYATIQSLKSPNDFTKTPAIEQKFELLNGFKHFRIDLNELARLSEREFLDDSIITIDAYVSESNFNMISSGFASAKIITNRYKLNFLGSPIQVFRRNMPFKVYCMLLEENNVQIDYNNLINKDLTITSIVYYHDHEQILYERIYTMFNDEKSGIWEINLNLFDEIDKKDLDQIRKIVLNATYLNENFISSTWSSETYFNSSNNFESISNRRKAILYNYITLVPYQSASKSNLKIWTTTNFPRINENIVFHVRSDFSIKTLNYIILSKKMILTTGRIEMEYTIKTFSLTVTSQMSPESTILIYCINDSNEFISDSLNFPVNFFIKTISSTNKTNQIENTNESSFLESDFLQSKTDHEFHNDIKISNIYKESAISYNQFKIDIFGQEADNIILTSIPQDVQKAYFNFDFTKISLELNFLKYENFPSDLDRKFLHIFQDHYGFETKLVHFATPDTGSNSNQIFKNLGLILFSDADQNTCLSTNCFNESIETNFQKCHLDSNKPYCILFEHNKKQEILNRKNLVQNYFKPNWLWNNIILDQSGQKTLNFNAINLKVSLWTLTLFSINTNAINLINKNIEFYNDKTVQLKLRYPKNCIVGEHISIQANLVNYINNPVEVLMIIELSDAFEFMQTTSSDLNYIFFSENHKFNHENLFLVDAEQTNTINFAIQVKFSGLVKIKFIARTSTSSETETAIINVHESFYTNSYEENIILDLKDNFNLVKYLDVNSLNKIPIDNYNEQNITFSLFSDCLNHLLSSNSNANNEHMNNVLDQSIFNYVMNLFTLIYFKESNLLNRSNSEDLIKKLNIYLQTILSYQNIDGGFYRFKLSSKHSDIKLTSYILKAFSLSNRFKLEEDNPIKIDQAIIDKTILFLINQQNSQGIFIDNSNLVRKSNQTKEKSFFNDLELTSIVIIALSNVKSNSFEIQLKLDFIRKNSEQFLNSMLDLVASNEDPYLLCLLAYCLNLNNFKKAKLSYRYISSKLQILNEFAYWKKREENSNLPLLAEKNGAHKIHDKYRSILTTSYGLLTFLINKSYLEKQIINWLIINVDSSNEYVAIENHLIAVEAILNYYLQTKDNYLKNFQIDLDNFKTNEKFKLGSKQEHKKSFKSRVQNLSENNLWIIKTAGSGYGVLQLKLNYAIKWNMFAKKELFFKETNYLRNIFDLKVNYFLVEPNYHKLKLELCLKTKLKNSIIVLRFRIPTGFYISQNDLNSIVQDQLIPYLKEATFISHDQISLFFHKLGNYEVCVPLSLQRIYLVAKLNPYILFKMFDLNMPKLVSHKLVTLHELNKITICDLCGSYQCTNCTFRLTNLSSSTSKNKLFIKMENLIFNLIVFYLISFV